MKVKLDENVPQDAVEYLRLAGLDVTSVLEQGLAGADDPRIYGVCQEEDRVLITLDVGFADLLTYPPRQSAGVVVLRLKRQGRDAVMGALRAIVEHLRHGDVRCRLWIVDEHRIRVRQ